jgi:hypothetical protein
MAEWGPLPGQPTTRAEPRVTWGTITATYEKLRTLTQKAPDPEHEKRDRERIRRKEALDHLKASPHWWVIEETFAQLYDEYHHLVAQEAEPPAAFRVLIDVYQRLDLVHWTGQQALKRLTTRRMAAHQRLSQMPVPPSANEDMDHG